jgi:hypothetical protein
MRGLRLLRRTHKQLLVRLTALSALVRSPQLPATARVTVQNAVLATLSARDVAKALIDGRQLDRACAEWQALLRAYINDDYAEFGGRGGPEVSVSSYCL